MKQKIFQWLQEFVEVPNSLLGNWAPCPFVRKARITNQIGVFPGNLESVDFAIRMLDEYEVVVLYFDHNGTDWKEMELLVAKLNKDLSDNDLVILMDHPDRIEYINGLKMNFGLSGLLVIQSLSKLTTAEEHLKQKGYYNAWSNTELDEVVAWRHD